MTTTSPARQPAMRILVPLACGILTHPAAPFWQLPSLLILVAAIGYLWIHHISQQPNERLRWRPFLIAPLSLCALALGWGAAIIHEPAHIDTSLINGKVLTGRVVGLDYTDFSMRLKVDVLDHDLPQCKVLVSTRGCDYTMQAGDLVAWPAELIEVSNLGNPDEMDYASYLLHSEEIPMYVYPPPPRCGSPRICSLPQITPRRIKLSFLLRFMKNAIVTGGYSYK